MQIKTTPPSPNKDGLTLLNKSMVQITTALCGRTIKYWNEKNSTVTKDGVRHFVVQAVERIWTAQNGQKCVTVGVRDVDDTKTKFLKYRTLHLAHIKNIV